MGSEKYGAGRVEVKIGGVWGTIHDLDWELEEARVVCRQLGYADAISALKRASAIWLVKRSYTKETPEWIRRIKCSGNEEKITDCRYEIQQMPNYGRDAGVICQSDKGKEGLLFS